MPRAARRQVCRTGEQMLRQQIPQTPMSVSSAVFEFANTLQGHNNPLKHPPSSGLKAYSKDNIVHSHSARLCHSADLQQRHGK